MCGIVGAIGPDGQRNAARMRVMRGRLVHRGPDSEGEALLDGAALGVRRLRIIDLRTGDQPQCNENETVWTVFNGEIYNFRELREELLAGGHHFRTASDTEVIVHLYEALRDSFVSRLEGMFALAVWDARERRLLLARDRMGKKPLLYRVEPDGLTFASEHAALIAAGPRAAADPSAIHLYLRLGYVPSPLDAFRGIRKLPPASVLSWHDGHVAVRPYWSLPEPGTRHVDPREAVEEVRRLVDRAVARRLVADVPLGAFLSGGLDSSAVVAAMARHSDRVRTFTIDFAETAFSEARYARLVARTFDADHHEFTVRAEHFDGVERLVEHFGEPFADSSALPTYYLSQLTRSEVTVALTGDGGDEVFAGYDRYVAIRLAEMLSFVPGAVRDLAGWVAHRLPAGSRAAVRAGRFADAWRSLMPQRYVQLIQLFDEDGLRKLLAPTFSEIVESAGGPMAGLAVEADDAVTWCQMFDLRRYLPDDLLVKVDIASMASSLEVRSPLLDRELVEFVMSLPVEVRMPGLERKSLLRRAMRGVLPPEIIARSKRGFGVPIGKWLRGPLGGRARELLLSDTARGRGYFRPSEVEALVRQHDDGSVDHAHRLWALLMLELWHRVFIDEPTTAEIELPA